MVILENVEKIFIKKIKTICNLTSKRESLLMYIFVIPDKFYTGIYTEYSLSLSFF